MVQLFVCVYLPSGGQLKIAKYPLLPRYFLAGNKRKLNHFKISDPFEGCNMF
jgi:hypothetical protein